jgi:hypothetical protein
VTRDWFLGLLSGLIGAAFGVLLYMFWDLWKDKRTTGRRTRALLELIETDLATNLGRLRHNLGALSQELNILGDRMSIVEPLPLMRTGFWEIMRLEPTSKLLTLEEKVALHNLFDLSEGVNERLRAREYFKNNNGAMSNFPSTMKIHDEELIKALNTLHEAMRTLGHQQGPDAPERPSA